jgi:hypothetical protein
LQETVLLKSKQHGLQRVHFSKQSIDPTIFFLLRMGVSLFTIGFSMNKTINNQLLVVWFGLVGWNCGALIESPPFPKGQPWDSKPPTQITSSSGFFFLDDQHRLEIWIRPRIGIPPRNHWFRSKIAQIIPFQF